MPSEREKELTLLNYIIKSPEVYKENREDLADYRMEYQYAIPIYSILTKCIEKYGAAPTVVEAAGDCEKWADEHNYSDMCREKLRKDLEEAYTIGSSPKSGELLTHFIFNKKSKLLANKLLTASPEQFEDKIKEFTSSFQSLASIGKKAVWEPPIAPFSEEGIKFLVSQINEANNLTRIPTGFPMWDERLLGGVRAGEVMLLLGSTGRGKSALGLNIAFHNAWHNDKRIVYITMDNQPEEFGERLFARWLQQNIGGVFNPVAMESALLKKMRSCCKYNLLMRFWLPQRHTPADIQVELERIKAYYYDYDKEQGLPEEECGHIDALVVDYLEKMLPPRELKTDQTHMNIFYTTEEIVNLSKTWGFPTFLLSQATVEALKSETAQIWMSGGSTSKLQPPAHVGILSQSDEERLASPMEMKMIVGKSRRPGAAYCVPFIVDTYQQHIQENPLKVIVPLASMINTGASASLSAYVNYKKEQEVLVTVARGAAGPAEQTVGKVALTPCQEEPTVVESKGEEFSEAGEVVREQTPEEKLFFDSFMAEKELERKLMGASLDPES